MQNQVHEMYSQWAFVEGFPKSDDECLKQKFDRLSNENKKIGQGFTSTPVRSAKRIAKDILERAQTVALGVEEDSDDSSSITMYLTNEIDIIGERRITNSRTD